MLVQIICYSMGVICDRESSLPTWLKHYGIYTSQLITNTAGVVTFCPYFFVHKISLNQTYHSICQFSVNHVVSRALLRFTTSGYSVGINLQLTCNIFDIYIMESAIISYYQFDFLPMIASAAVYSSMVFHSHVEDSCITVSCHKDGS